MSSNKQKSGPDSFTGKIYKAFREELTPPPCQTQKKKPAEEGKLPTSFYEATITLIPKPDKDFTCYLFFIKVFPQLACYSILSRVPCVLQ